MRSTFRTGLLCAGILAAFSLPGAAQSMRVEVVDRPDTTQSNKYYDGNRAPLLPSPLIKLPFGAIKPLGWLRKQLELEADGFTGHLIEISPYCNKNNNAWLNPEGIGDAWWEEVPYWLRGFTALGYVLDDQRIIAEAKLWMENAIASQTEFGYFGTQGNLMGPVQPPVPGELLTTADGKPGLDGEYFSDAEFKNSVLKRVDPNIDFNWGEKAPADGIPNKEWTARWTGFITVKETGDYTFSISPDDGGRLWINNEQLVDFWRVGVQMTKMAKAIKLEAGKKYPIKIEYWQAAGGAACRFGWKMPGAEYDPRGGAPDFMPNMSMMYALRSYYEYTGDKRIIGMLTNYYKWQLSVPDNKFFAGGWQWPRNGDNMDSVYWLYNITGDKFLLDLEEKLMRTGASWMSGKVGGGHNVDYSQGFRKPAQFYQQSKDPKYLAATEGNYDSMYAVYGQVPGGMFGGDEFARPGYTDPQNAIETCGAIDMMLSQETLQGITGDPKWADRCEDVAFNTLPACFTSDLKALRYLTSPNQTNSDKRSKYPVLADGGPMQVMDPYSHRCCQHNSGMGWPYFTQHLWQVTPDNGICAVMYSPSKVSAKVGDGTKVIITEDTQYPFDGKISISMATAKSVKFPLYFRIPAWCDKPAFKVNGKAIKADAKPLSYVMIERTWANNDKVLVDFPMLIKLRTWAKNKDAVSVDRGPLTFSVKIAEKYVPYEPQRKWAAWEIMADSSWNYGLVIDKNNPNKSFKVVTKPWPASGQPFRWDAAPVELRVKAKKIPNWTENLWGTIDKLQQSPISSDSPVETISMIPMGAARLRVSAIPVIGNAPDAKKWIAFEEPISSATHPAFPIAAMYDGKAPEKSSLIQGRTFSAFAWWPETNGNEYVISKFDEAKDISSCEVFWYADDDATGKIDSWTLLYKDGNGWKPVANPSGYGREMDKFNVVTFDKVKTTAIKLQARLGGRSGGIYEWRIK
ncbi:MAG: glycoside hydrolase family 127 protein [Armatimonadetes bacterium]|nr:glycoside hydrolase family 127 protein [Armatimonadota bacterium]